MLKNSLLALITIISFEAAAQNKIQKIETRPVTDFACTREFSNKLAKDLHEYLLKPTPANTRNMAIRLCEASSEGQNPCPFNMNQERVAEFETAGRQNPGVIPVLACAVKVADGAIAEELNELQASLLDKHQAKFFIAWQTIPKEVKGLAQTFSDFVMIAPDGPDDFSKKIKIYESRIKILENAPYKLKPEFIESLSQMKEATASAHEEMPESPHGDIVFKLSKFRTEITDKFIRLTSTDPKKAAVIANQVLLNEGLNYKVYLKGTSNSWSICSTSTDSVSDCHVADVSYSGNTDSCGKFALLGALAQLHGQWILPTATTQFRVNANSYLSPMAARLQKSDNVVRFWNIPEQFFAEYISPDLKTMYFKTVIKSDVGRRLAELHLQVRDYAQVQFVDLTDMTPNLIALSAKPMQTLKGTDGSRYNLHLPQACK